MPEYTFRCRKCKNETRIVLPFSATINPSQCPCGGEMHRVFNTPHIIYRGSGWYTKDKVLYDVDEDDQYD